MAENRHVERLEPRFVGGQRRVVDDCRVEFECRIQSRIQRQPATEVETEDRNAVRLRRILKKRMGLTDIVVTHRRIVGQFDHH